jgi:Glycine cleavage system T protein (aminomethyltransferase)
VITSGGFGPSVDAPVAMGYVATDYAKVGTPLTLMVRGKALPAKVCTLPFITKRYAK